MKQRIQFTMEGKDRNEDLLWWTVFIISLNCLLWISCEDRELILNYSSFSMKACMVFSLIFILKSVPYEQCSSVLKLLAFLVLWICLNFHLNINLCFHFLSILWNCLSYLLLYFLFQKTGNIKMVSIYRKIEIFWIYFFVYCSWLVIYDVVCKRQTPTFRQSAPSGLSPNHRLQSYCL